MTHITAADDFDCGDGVPDMPLSVGTVAKRTPSDATISPRAAIMGLVVAGQVVLLVAVLAGGSPIVGAGGAVALLTCGLTMVAIRKAKDTGPQRGPTTATVGPQLPYGSGHQIPTDEPVRRGRAYATHDVSGR